MSPLNIPFDSYYAEALRDRLKEEIEKLLTELHAAQMFGFISQKPYERDYGPVWDLVHAFADECRDNFLRTSDETMARRYGALLGLYFSFVPIKREELSMESIYVDNHQEEEAKTLDTTQKEAASAYYFSITSDAWHFYIKLLPFVERTVEECKRYFTEGLTTVNEAIKEPPVQPVPTSGIPTVNQEPAPKLTWSCKPAVAGYIVSELVRAGYLSPPTTNGELSLNKLAKICDQLFDIADHNPSLSSWRNVLDPERNALSETKRARLNLPDSDQL